MAATISDIPHANSTASVDNDSTSGIVTITLSEAKGDIEKQMSQSFTSSRCPEEDPGHIVPTRFEKFMVERTICAFCLFLALALCGVCVTGAMFTSKSLQFTSASVWDVRSDPVVERLQAFTEARKDSQFVDGANSLPERRGSLTELTLIYKINGEEGDIFQEKYLQQIAKIESQLLDAAEWQKYCQLVDGKPGEPPRCTGGNSVLDLVQPGVPDGLQLQELQAGFGECPAAAAACAGNTNYTVGRVPCTSRAFNAVNVADGAATFSSSADFREELRCICCAQTPSAVGCENSKCTDSGSNEFCGRSVQDLRSSARILHIGAQMSCNTATASLVRSRYSFGHPLPGFVPTDDAEKDMDKQFEELTKWTGNGLLQSLQKAVADASEATDGSLQVWVLGAGIGENQYSQWILQDQFFAIGSILIVFIWIWGGVGSSFLACCGMAEIILAIPLSFAIWGVMQLKIVTGFMLTILFLILGIGADDIFVLWDAFQQAGTFFKNRADNSEVNRFAWALRRARSAMSVTSATTFCGLAAAGVSQIPSISAFGIFGAIVVLFDFLMVISFFAAAVLIFSRYLAHRCGPCTALSSLLDRCRQHRTLVTTGVEPSQYDGLRPVEAFFKNHWSPTVLKYRWAILVVWALVCIISVAVPVALLHPAEEAPQLFWTDYKKQMMQFASGKGFISSSSQAKVPIHVVFGINTKNPIDRSGTNYQDPEALGEPIFDAKAAATLASPEGQLELWQFCEDARNGAVPDGRLSQDSEGCTVEYVQGVRLERSSCQTGVTCFIDWVKDYRIEYTKNFTENTWHTENLNVPLNSPAFWAYLEHMQNVRSNHGLPDTLPFKNSWIVMSGQTLKWAFVSFNSTLDLELMPLVDILPHFDDWEAYIANHLSALSGFQVCGMWSWMATQQELLRSVFTSLGTCLVFAWSILCIATANWIVASLSLVCIVVILSVFALFITAMGWSLGIFEAVGLIVVAGLSVDYTVHISHSFNECRYINGVSADRSTRMTHALTEMGISVVSGAATTLLASLFLLPTSFTFYFLFGIFMLATVIVSLLVALTLLPALLSVVGPEDGRGDLTFLGNVGSWLASCCSKGVTREDRQTDHIKELA